MHLRLAFGASQLPQRWVPSSLPLPSAPLLPFPLPLPGLVGLPSRSSWWAGWYSRGSYEAAAADEEAFEGGPGSGSGSGSGSSAAPLPLLLLLEEAILGAAPTRVKTCQARRDSRSPGPRTK